MGNLLFNFEVIFTEDLFFKVNIQITSKKRRKILLYFIVVTILALSLILIDLLGPNIFHTFYVGCFLLAFSILSLMALVKSRPSALKKQIINARGTLPQKSTYRFYEDRIMIDTESMQSKIHSEYQYFAISRVEKVDPNIVVIFFTDKKTAIIESKNSEELLNHIRSRKI
jgi:hypothetical protein